MVCRFGYNQHLNGNDREMGGRSGYPDERPHGRHGGRSSGGYESGPSGIFLLPLQHAIFRSHNQDVIFNSQ